MAVGTVLATVDLRATSVTSSDLTHILKDRLSQGKQRLIRFENVKLNLALLHVIGANIAEPASLIFRIEPAHNY